MNGSCLWFLEVSRTGSGFSWLRESNLLGYTTCLVTKNVSAYAPERIAEFEAAGGCVLEVPELEISSLKKIAESCETPPSCVISNSDSTLLLASQLSSELGLECIPPDVLQTFRDKYLLHKELKKHGIPCPEAEELTANPSLQLPVVAKPVTGTGSVGVWYLHDWSRLDELFAAEREMGTSYLLQSYIDGPLVSAEVAVGTAGKYTVLGHTDRELGKFPYFVESAYSFPTLMEERDRDAIEAAVAKIVQVYSLSHCLLHIEFILSDQGPVLIEVNPRSGGGFIPELMNYTMDHTFYRHAIQQYCGETVEWTLPTRGASADAYYSDRDGVIQAIEGVEHMGQSLGVMGFEAFKQVGDPVSRACDYRGALLHGWAGAENSNLARMRIKSAMTKARVDME